MTDPHVKLDYTEPTFPRPEKNITARDVHDGLVTVPLAEVEGAFAYDAVNSPTWTPLPTEFSKQFAIYSNDTSGVRRLYVYDFVKSVWRYVNLT